MGLLRRAEKTLVGQRYLTINDYTYIQTWADAKGKPFHALKYVGNDVMSRSGVLYASHKLRCSLIPSFAWQSVEMTNYDCECILRKARVLWLNAGAFQHLFSKKAMSALSC